MTLSHAVWIDGLSDILSTLQRGNHYQEKNMPIVKRAECLSRNRFSLLAADDAVESDGVEDTESSERLDERENSPERQNEEEVPCEQTGHHPGMKSPSEILGSEATSNASTPLTERS